MAKKDAEQQLEATTNLSEADIESMLKSFGLSPKSSMAELSKAISSHGGLTTTGDIPGGAGGGGVPSGGLAGDLYRLGGDVVHYPTTLGQAAEQVWTGQTPDTSTPPPTKPKAKTAKAADAKLPAPEAAATSPFTELAQALAQQYLNQVNQLTAMTSGAQTPGLEAEAQGGALQALKGLGVGGVAQQFVANQPTVPLAGQVGAAQQAMGNAQAVGGLGVGGAIGAMGPAEAATLSAAPWATLLNELVSESAYRASSPSYGPSALGLTTANTPAWLQSSLGQIGLNVPKPGQGSATGASGLIAPGTAAKGGTGSTSSALSSSSSPTG